MRTGGARVRAPPPPRTHTHTPDVAAEIAATAVLHDEELAQRHVHHLVELDDVGVVERLEDADLARHPLPSVRLGKLALLKRLDRHLLSREQVRAQLHLAVGALAQRPPKRVEVHRREGLHRRVLAQCRDHAPQLLDVHLPRPLRRRRRGPLSEGGALRRRARRGVGHGTTLTSICYGCHIRAAGILSCRWPPGP